MVNLGLSNREPVPSTVSSFVANLPELLGAFYGHAHPYVAIAEFDDERYIQLWVEQDRVIAEVVSNHYAENERLLSETEEHQLAEAGWTQPQPEKMPNWRVERRGYRGLHEVVAMAAHAVIGILGEGLRANAAVQVRTFAPRRAALGSS